MTNKHLQLNEGAVFSGFFFGVIVGAFITLLRGPRIRLKRENLSHAKTYIRDALTVVDPIKQSIAEGKEAARRRRSDLGLTMLDDA